jgi:hypothetical protein
MKLPSLYASNMMILNGLDISTDEDNDAIIDSLINPESTRYLQHASMDQLPSLANEDHKSIFEENYDWPNDKKYTKIFEFEAENKPKQPFKRKTINPSAIINKPKISQDLIKSPLIPPSSKSISSTFANVGSKFYKEVEHPDEK